MTETIEQTIEQTIKNLLSSHPILLFMKGDKYMPKCGFSKAVVEILNELGANYTTYDILENEQLRQALKKFSDWPTYPQLYIDGELIGGADIIKETYLTGELQNLLDNHGKRDN